MRVEKKGEARMAWELGKGKEMGGGGKEKGVEKRGRKRGEKKVNDWRRGG